MAPSPIREILAADQAGFPVLSTLVFVPIVVALVVLAIRDPRAARRAAITGALVEGLVTIFVLTYFARGTADMQFVERLPWIPTLGASYHLGLDGLSVLFVTITVLLTGLILVTSPTTSDSGGRGFYAGILALSSMAIGIFTSLDLVLFFVFWEMSLVPVFFLVSLWGAGPERRYAAMKFVLTMLGSSGPLLLGIVLLAVLGRESSTDPLTFDWMVLRERQVPPAVGTTVFFLVLVGLAVKGPFVPLHTWMPTMLRECPVALGVVMTGLKFGCYGALRLLLPLVPEATARHAWLLGAIGATGIVYGALIALVQPNLRRLLSFSCLSHVGYILLGISTGSVEGISGAALAMLNLGLSATGLFFVTGFLQARVGSSETSALGGVAQRAPRAAVMFVLFGLASIGLPGTSGFVGEHLILLATYRTNLVLMGLALFGTVLGAAYILSVFEKGFLGPVTRPRVASMKDLQSAEWGVLVCLSMCILVIGVYPGPVLALIEPSAQALARQVLSR
jgi:NADH-quinone oxidoreductase subunit M